MSVAIIILLINLLQTCVWSQSVSSSLVCEHSTLSLQCDEGKKLNIISANYGRNAGRDVCPHSSIRVTSGCNAASSLNKVRDACQDRQDCSIRASNGVFGDPCVGTYKYLQVTYSCVVPDVSSSLVCEHSTLSLQCDEGKKLNIISANYGRNAGRDVCPHSSIRVTSGCNAASSLNKVRDACQDRQECSIRASNGVFGDPCVGTYKYLQVTYSCVVAGQSSSLVCEHSTLSLQCDAGKKLNIISANYGRNAGRDVCPHQSIQVTSGCNAASSLNKVQEACQDRQECSIQASNGVFGDPCVGTYKYLQVTYSCLVDGEGSSLVCEHSTLSLQCDAGKKLNIISANYGRNAGRDVCPHQSIQVTSGCNAASSLNKVQEACQNRQECSIQASNGVFGDPCVGTYKYLQVTYSCLVDGEGSSLVCEHSTLSLQCDAGKKLNIISANYGRNAGRDVCPHQSIQVTSGCNAASSLNKVQEACQNRQECSIQASNGVFGDPCVGTYKYLQVTYSCLVDGEGSSLVCEHSTLSLQCDAGKKLNIISANYGRNAGRDVCPHQSIQVTSGCNAASSLSKVQEACQDRQECSIQASNGVFGDPCVGTYKYLQVTYSCLVDGEGSSLVCEHSTLSLQCDAGKKLNIISANYGRNAGRDVCPHQSIQVTSGCNAASSLSKVQEACQDRQECSIQASNGVFGDPCVGTYKYLQVTYSCLVDGEGSSLVCEHSTLSLQCDAGKKLNIISANYGRNAGRDVCPHQSIQVTSGCNAASSLSKVQEACQNRQECSIQASNGVFGDPCVGTYKYLQVTYSCLVDGEGSSLVCEHSTLSLQCDAGKKLNIISANYGRNAGRDVCPHQSIQVTSGCNAASSLSKVQEACQNRQECSIQASNGVFGDPCVGTYKYLEVTYSCVVDGEGSSLVCEHSTLSLQCDEGKKLKIISANYGRNAGPDVCPHHSIQVTSGCNAASSLNKVQAACQGRQDCSIQASNGVFGDPCVGTYKYLEVTYSCVIKGKHCGG